MSCLISLYFITSKYIASVQSERFSLEPINWGEARLGPELPGLVLSYNKPPNIRKEPAYRARPKYGVIRLGNGPKSQYVVALDEPTVGDWKIYIDRNRTGDLTALGDGSWNIKNNIPGRGVEYGPMEVTLRASYGSPTNETSSASYTIALDRFTGREILVLRTDTVRVGSIVVGGKVHKAMLIENDADALFNKPAEYGVTPSATNPVWLRVDLNDDDDYVSGAIDVRGPFKLEGKTYELKVADDGSTAKLVPSKRISREITRTIPAFVHLLKPGIKAPEFTVEKWGGSEINLSDYPGKVVVLYFWPPGGMFVDAALSQLEEIQKRVHGQDVVFITICERAGKASFAAWMQQNEHKYHFVFGYDPQGEIIQNSALLKAYRVTYLSATYIVDRRGKIVDGFYGYPSRPVQIEAAFRKVGVKLN